MGGTFDRGMDFWNDSSTIPVSVTGGSIASSRVGIELDAVDPLLGGVGSNVNSTVNVTNVAISGATSEGIFVDAEPLAINTFGASPNTVNGNVTLNLSGGSITSSTVGVLVETVNAPDRKRPNWRLFPAAPPSRAARPAFQVNGPTASANVNNTKVSGASVGVDIDGSAVLTFDTITGNGRGVVVDNTGTLTSATNNLISRATWVMGSRLCRTAAAVGPISLNSLGGNGAGSTGFSIDNLSTMTIDASANWWGVNTEARRVAPLFLAAGHGRLHALARRWHQHRNGLRILGRFVEIGCRHRRSPGPRQRGHACVQSAPQTGGRINEAIFDLVTGGTIKVSAGSYNETVTVTKTLTLRSFSGAVPTIINNTAVVPLLGTIVVNAGVTRRQQALERPTPVSPSDLRCHHQPTGVW